MSNWDAKTAEWYASNYGDYATNRIGLEGLDLHSNSVVVDIGCGTGSALRYAAEQFPSGQFIGVDPVPRMVEIAKEHTVGHSGSDRISFIEGGAECIPLADDVADVVLAFDSFDHWEDQAKGLEEVRRVLKPAGLFVVVKDGGLPGGKKAKARFTQALEGCGFAVFSEEALASGNVKCTRWVCQLGK